METVSPNVSSTEWNPFVVSYEARVIFQLISYSIVCQFIDVFGTVTNIINIICFVKMGFKDHVNISLCGLAISDLGCLVTLIWLNICYIPKFQEADLPFEIIGILTMTGGWPHVIFSRVTSWITAFVTLERCLCITLPLKVKTIFTTKRVTIIITSIFVTLIFSAFPVYYTTRFGLQFIPKRNKSIIALIYTEDRTLVEQIAFPINNVLIPFGAFITVAICTVTLVVKLRSKAKWRQQAATSNSDNLVNRDQKVATMIVTISTLFIISFVPICIIFIGMVMEPEFSIEGKYQNILMIMGGLSFLLESVNSTVNIFIYYNMSSKYRTVLRQLFRLQNEVK